MPFGNGGTENPALVELEELAELVGYAELLGYVEVEGSTFSGFDLTRGILWMPGDMKWRDRFAVAGESSDRIKLGCRR